MRILLAALLVAGMVACQDESPVAVSKERGSFFDLPAYFSEEVTRLTAAQQQVIKTSVFNGVEEQTEPEDIDWEKEFGVYTSSDINLPSWRDKYVGDTSLTANGQIARITYQAQEEDLRTQRLVVDYQASKVEQIIITNELDSKVAVNKQTLIYRPDQGYEVQAFQKLPLRGSDSMSVRVRWKK